MLTAGRLANQGSNKTRNDGASRFLTRNHRLFIECWDYDLTAVVHIMQDVQSRWQKAYSNKQATIHTTTTTNHRYVVSQLTFLVSWPQNLNKPYLTFFYFERFHGLLRIQLLTSSAWDSKKHKNYHKMKESWLMMILNVKCFLSYFDILINEIWIEI